MLVLRARPTLQVPQYVLLRHVLLHVHVHLRGVVVRLVQYLYPYLTLPHVRRRHELCGEVLPAGAEGGGLGRLGFCTYISRRRRLEVSCLLEYSYMYVYTYVCMQQAWLHKTGYSLELYAYARGARRSPQKKRIFTMIEFTDQHLLIFGIVLALSILRERKRVRAHWPPREHPRAAVGLHALRRRALGVDRRRGRAPARDARRPRGRREGAGAGEPAWSQRVSYSQ